MLLSSIGGGVLFAIAFAVLNTMLMAGRERTPDLAILKALGFGDNVAAALLLSESLLLCGLGALVGLGLVLLAEGGLAEGLRSFLPGFGVSPRIMLLGMGLALGIGAVAGLIPAWQARQLRCVDALRAEG
jgi:putative ABC transport system permease protein